VSTSAPSLPARPPQVVWACRLAWCFSTVVLIAVATTLGDWGSPNQRQQLQEGLAGSSLTRDLDAGQVLEAVRYTLIAVAAASVAALLAAGWVARGHAGARVLLTVLAASSPLAAPLLGLGGVFIAAAGIACAVLLWTSPARTWFKLVSPAPGAPMHPPGPSSPKRAPMSHPAPPPDGDPTPRPVEPGATSEPPRWPGASGQPPSYEQPSQSPQPYGQQPAQPEYGQSGPPQYGQPQYGQPSGQPQQYGQYGQASGQPQQYGQPYGAQPYAYGQSGYDQGGYGSAPMSRPGAVTAAAVITFVLSGLALLASLIAGVSVLAARDGIKDELLKDQNFRNTFDRGDIDTVVTFVGLGALFFALLALLGIVLAALVLRGRGWARIALIVLSVPTAVLGLIGFGAAFPLLWTLGAIAVIVLLSLGQVRQWFAMRGYEGSTA